jgi:hypothetical protein
MVLLGALGLKPTQAFADYYVSGARLNEMCQARIDALCETYVLAVVDAMLQGTHFAEKPGPDRLFLFLYDGSNSIAESGIVPLDRARACPPQNATAPQYKAVVKKHLLEHPEDLHLSAAS